MTSKQKILQVMENIKSKSEISPDSQWVRFNFNTFVGGANIVSYEEEFNIVMKLRKAGSIELFTQKAKSNVDDSAILDDFINENNYVWIKISPTFWSKYYLETITTLIDNKWNYINPFWISWQLLQGIFFLIKWLWNKTSLLTKVFFSALGLFAYDWSQAWKNVKILLIFLKIR